MASRIITIILATLLTVSPVNSSEDTTFQEQVKCMALNIYHEARGESTKGMLAVAYVTMNRVMSPKFPSTVCEVVFQPGQFSWTMRSTYKKTIPEQFYALAERVIIGQVNDLTNGALFFHNTTIPVKQKRVKARIGNHIFY